MTDLRRATDPRMTALLLAIAAFAPPLAAQSSNRPAVLEGSGRFVFGQVNELVADQYMLDTQTGRLWRLVDTADGTGSVLEPVPYALPDGGSQAMPPEPQAAAPDAARLVPIPPPGR